MHRSPRDVQKTIGLGVIWWGIALLRSRVISPHCVENPLTCSLTGINAFDRIWMGPSRPLAGAISDDMQAVAAVFTFAMLIAHHEKNPKPIIRDAILLIQCAFLNGILLEFVRMLTQRPRPFVVQDLAMHGMNAAHYNSFYSGHTSFVACIGFAGFYLLRKYKAKDRIRWIQAAGALLCVVITGSLRVIDQAHYATDVLIGSVMGGVAGLLNLKLFSVSNELDR